MASRNFSPPAGDNASSLRGSAAEAAASLGLCDWWTSEKVAEVTAAIENIENSKCSVLHLAALLDSAAEYMEGLVTDKNKVLGSIYSGDGGVAYALLRKAERLLEQKELFPYAAEEEIETAAATAAATAAETAEKPAAEKTDNGDGGLSAGSDAAEEADEALRKAISLLSREEDSEETKAAAKSLRRRFTFLQGQVGHLAVNAVALHLLKRENAAFSTLRRLAVTAAAAATRLQPEECELLYGRAGLLYALLFTRVLWLPPPPPSPGISSSLSAAAGSGGDTQQQQQQEQQEEEISSLFSDCEEVNRENSSGIAKSSNKETWLATSSSGSSAALREIYLNAALSSSVGMRSKFHFPGSFGFGWGTPSSSMSNSSGSMQELLTFSSRRVTHDREATRILILSLIAQLVGQLATNGRIGAAVSDGGGILSLGLKAKKQQPASASAAFDSEAPLPFVYEWHGKEYLGAAHGICGILLQLLNATDTLHQAALAGCFPGPATNGTRDSAEVNKLGPQEEAEAAAERLLTCSSAVCSAMQTSKNKGGSPSLCAAAAAFLSCSDGVAAAVALRDAVRRLCLRAIIALLRSHLTDNLNLKSSVGSTKDVLVQWCHGAPGLLPLLCWAVDVHREELVSAQQQQRSNTRPSILYPQQQPDVYKRNVVPTEGTEACAKEDFGFFLVWLDTLASVTWRRGLLRKGLGICHGIGGNGLALLRVYTSTREPKWLRRALLFALEGITRHQQLLSLPDRPFSLFEGVAGFAVFLRDCAELLRVRCRSDRRATFYYPGYELPPLPWESCGP